MYAVYGTPGTISFIAFLYTHLKQIYTISVTIWTPTGHAIYATPASNICDINCDIDGLVQDRSKSITNALELLQSYTKPSIHGSNI